MMREIKFRAWTENTWLTDTLKEKMIYDYQDTTLVEVFGFNSEELPVMQFTGLIDKNGKEIYEGDILDWEINSNHDMYLGSGEVIYIEGAFWSCGRYLSEMVRYHQAKIIGNIYEHSHLLEGK